MPMSDDLYGRPDKAIRFPELIFQVAHIGKMEKLWIVDMQDKSRWIHPDLGAVIYFQLAPGMGWSRVGILGIP